MGTSASRAAKTSGSIASVMAVRIRPGCTALTRTPWWASSLAAAFVMPTMPALAAL